ncbi:hypothetical protein ACJQWK_03620 [Exserohilum turcicum]
MSRENSPAFTCHSVALDERQHGALPSLPYEARMGFICGLVQRHGKVMIPTISFEVCATTSLDVTLSYATVHPTSLVALTPTATVVETKLDKDSIWVGTLYDRKWKEVP